MVGQSVDNKPTGRYDKGMTRQASSARRRLPSSVRKAAIVEAATRLFASRGYERTRMEDVARAAGLTKGGLYFHFPDKMSLLRAVVVHHLEHYQALVLEALRSSCPARAAIRQLVKGLVDHMRPLLESGGGLGGLQLLVEGYRHEDIRGIIQEYSARFREALEGLLARGMAEGCLRKVDPALGAMGVTVVLKGLLLEVVVRPLEKMRLEELAVELVEMMVGSGGEEGLA